MSEYKNNDQDDVQCSPDKSTQSNESYHLLLSTNQIEKDLNSNIIQGLKLQKRFKDASYLQIKSTSIKINAYDTILNQSVIIKVRKVDYSQTIDESLKKVKELTDQNSQLFIQMIHYWILQKNDYSLVFFEMEYISQNLENYLINKTINGLDISEDEKQKHTHQILKCIKELELQEINTKFFKISNYLVKQGDIRLLIDPFNTNFIEIGLKENINKNDSNKNILFSQIYSQNLQFSNLFSTGVLILLVNNWLVFDDQIINNIGVFDFVNSIIQGKIIEYIQIDILSISYKIYQQILNNDQNNNSVQQYIDMLLKDKKIIINNQTQKEEQFDDNEDEYEEMCPQLVNKNAFMLLNPSLIINKYITSISNFNQNKTQNNQQEAENVEQIESIGQTYDLKIQQNNQQQQPQSNEQNLRVSNLKQHELNKSLQDSNQKQENNEQNNLINSKEQEYNLKEQSNNIKEQQYNLKEDKQDIIKEQVQLQKQQLQTLKDQELIIKDQQINEQEKNITINQSESTPAHSKLNASTEKLQIKQTIINCNIKNDYLIEDQNKYDICFQDRRLSDNQESKVIIFSQNQQQDNENNNNNLVYNNDQRQSIFKFQQQNQKDERLDMSYSNNNQNDIEMKDVDISIANSNRQKNLENSNIEQNPNDSYQRYLFDLDIKSDNVNQIYIMEMIEGNDCILYKLSCVQPINIIRLKLLFNKNPYLGKSIMEVIFIPFINIFNKPWIMNNNKKSNIFTQIISHLLLWIVKLLNIVIMLVFVTLYLIVLLTILLMIHVIYFISLLVMAIILIPVGFIRIYMRIYLKLSDWKSGIIFNQQNSYTWFQSDKNYKKAKDLTLFHNRMLYRKYQYLQSPNKQFINNNYQR